MLLNNWDHDACTLNTSFLQKQNNWIMWPVFLVAQVCPVRLTIKLWMSFGLSFGFYHLLLKGKSKLRSAYVRKTKPFWSWENRPNQSDSLPSIGHSQCNNLECLKGERKYWCTNNQTPNRSAKENDSRKIVRAVRKTPNQYLVTTSTTFSGQECKHHSPLISSWVIR